MRSHGKQKRPHCHLTIVLCGILYPETGGKISLFFLRLQIVSHTEKNTRTVLFSTIKASTKSSEKKMHPVPSKNVSIVILWLGYC